MNAQRSRKVDTQNAVHWFGRHRDDDAARRKGEPSTSGRNERLVFGDPRISGQVHRYLQRFIGHCNIQTDIKEACFLGGNDELVAAGSDDGRVFIYNAETGYPVRRASFSRDLLLHQEALL